MDKEEKDPTREAAVEMFNLLKDVTVEQETADWPNLLTKWAQVLGIPYIQNPAPGPWRWSRDKDDALWIFDAKDRPVCMVPLAATRQGQRVPLELTEDPYAVAIWTARQKYIVELLKSAAGLRETTEALLNELSLLLELLKESKDPKIADKLNKRLQIIIPVAEVVREIVEGNCVTAQETVQVTE